MIEYDVAVMYTDGSCNKYGSGCGVHAYCYNTKNLPHIDKGYVVEYTTEVLCGDGYKQLPRSGLPTAIRGVDFDVWNCRVPLNNATAQVAELTAFITCFKSVPFTAKKYFIISDSAYMINSVTQWIDGWKKNNWLRSDGSVLQNLNIIKAIDEIKSDLKTRNIKLELIKIKGHSGRCGNEYADELATSASGQCVNNNVEYKPQWVKHEDSVQVEDKSEELVDIGIPSILTHKYHYISTNTPDDYSLELNGNNWYVVLSGNHAKNKDDLALLGKYIPDAMFSVTLHQNRINILNNISDYHYNIAWENSDYLDEYDTITIIHGEHLRRKKVIDYAKTKNFFNALIPLEENNALFFDDLLISKMARPPLLAYRAYQIEDELLRYLKSAFDDKSDTTKLTDITDLLFDVNGKPKKDFYQMVDKSFTVMADTINGNKLKVILSKDIDIPSRVELNRIKEPTGRFYVATILINYKWYKYCVIYKGEKVHGLWMGYYSANRIVE